MNSSDFFTVDVSSLSWEQSYATVNGERVIDTTQRSSKICTQKFIVDFPKELEFFAKTCKIKNSPQLELTLYKYEEGDFFASHIDRQRSQIHAYTLLILPPCSADSANCFQGGNLKIGSTTINCSSITEYTYLIFNIDMEHELEPILKGTRYVFKSLLEVDDETVTRNAFCFSKPIFRDFVIKFASSVTSTSKVMRSGDVQHKSIIKVDLPIKEQSEPPKSGGILETLRNMLNPDPNSQWPSDYDAEYYSQPLYRRSLYLRNKINKRTGKPMLMD